MEKIFVLRRKKFGRIDSRSQLLIPQAFLHIACHGLSGAGCSGPEFGPGGESDHLNAIKVDLVFILIVLNKFHEITRFD